MPEHLSKYRCKAACQKILRERPFIVAALSCLLIFAVGLTRNPEVKGVYEGRFWLMKFHWRSCADVVFAGDSRVCSCIHPAEMNRHLPGLRILNYAFDGVGYYKEYLEAIPKVLDSQSKRKIIILGITPRSLATSAITNDYYKDSKRKTKYHSNAILTSLDGLLQFLQPMALREIFYMPSPGKNQQHFFRNYSRDGWAGRYMVPEEPGALIDPYRETFIRNQVSPETINGLLECVRKWRNAGVEVYGFRPPTTSEMLEVERAFSGFDEEFFIASFQAAGGVWLNKADQTIYRTYDGSHLYPDAAEAFSRELARILSDSLNKKSTGQECNETGLLQAAMM